MSGWGQVSEDALGSELCGVSPPHNGCDFYLFLFSFYVIFKNHFEMCLKIKEDSRVSENCQVTLGNVRTELMKFRPAGATFGKDGREMLVCCWKGPWRLWRTAVLKLLVLDLSVL